MSLPLFSGLLASSRAAIVLAPDDIPTYKFDRAKLIIRLENHDYVKILNLINPDLT